MSTETIRSTPAVQHPAPGADTLEALSRLPGIRRAWPARDGSISIECRDEQGRLRAGTLAPQGTVSMLPYATDPAHAVSSSSTVRVGERSCVSPSGCARPRAPGAPPRRRLRWPPPRPSPPWG